MDLIAKLNIILAERSHTRVNGKVASERTAAAAGEALRACFRLLLELGYRLQDPNNIQEKHIKALCEEWKKRGRSPKTIQGYLSQLRIFGGWISKKGLVKDVHHYLPDVPREELRVSAVARKSKSWAEIGINVGEKIEIAFNLDERFGLMILAQISFGLRRLEVLQMKPWKCDKGNRFSVYKTKGGGPRDADIDTDAQRDVLDLIKSKIGKNDYLGWKTRSDGDVATLEYSERRYNYFMEKLGMTKALAEVTGHGLRAQFAENAALLRDLIPPTLGGTAGQKARDDLDVTRMQVSELLGHSRVSVTGAYYGSFGREVPLDGPDRARDTIEACLNTLTIDQVKPIPPEHLAQCMGLTTEVAMIGVYGDVRKIQALWEHHSRRHAVDWLRPSDRSNLAALEAAAGSILRATNPSSGSTPA